MNKALVKVEKKIGMGWNQRRKFNKKLEKVGNAAGQVGINALGVAGGTLLANVINDIYNDAKVKGANWKATQELRKAEKAEEKAAKKAEKEAAKAAKAEEKAAKKAAKAEEKEEEVKKEES